MRVTMRFTIDAVLFFQRKTQTASVTIFIRSANALLVCGDTTGKLCVLRVIEKAPGSVLLEKTLRVRCQYHLNAVRIGKQRSNTDTLACRWNTARPNARRK